MSTIFSQMKRVTLAGLISLTFLLFGCAPGLGPLPTGEPITLDPPKSSPVEQPQLEASPVVLTDLENIEQLQRRFQQDAGAPRLILLLSPT